MITLSAALSAGAKTYLRCNFSIFCFNDFTERLDGCLNKCGTELKVEDTQDMTFVNVHRIGRKINPKRIGRPRSIVAKFAYNKDISRVKQSTNKLKGKHKCKRTISRRNRTEEKKTLPDSKGRNKKEKIKSGASKRQVVRERHTR